MLCKKAAEIYGGDLWGAGAGAAPDVFRLYGNERREERTPREKKDLSPECITWFAPSSAVVENDDGDGGWEDGDGG